MAKTGSAPFSWSAFFTALASFSLFALLLGVVIALVVGLRPLEKRAAELSAKTPATIDIRWPEVPTTQRTNQRVTWVPQEEREQLVSLAQSAMGAQGLMQVIPRFHQDKLPEGADELSFFDPVLNVRIGARILKESIRRNGGEVAGLQQFAGASDDVDQRYSAKVLAEKTRLEAVVQRDSQRVSQRDSQRLPQRLSQREA